MCVVCVEGSDGHIERGVGRALCRVLQTCKVFQKAFRPPPPPTFLMTLRPSQGHGVDMACYASAGAMGTVMLQF